MKPSSMATLTPAYGRDYKTKAEAIADFRDGKDFVYNHFREKATYISIREYEAGQMVKIRFDQRRKACFYNVVERDLRNKGLAPHRKIFGGSRQD